jgi:hypothetical protein
MSRNAIYREGTNMGYVDKREAEIISVVVKFRTATGEERSVTVDGRSSDALFWSLEAIDRFALPFYLATEGFEKAAAIRQEANAQFAKMGLAIGPHKKYCLLPIVELDRGDPSPI